MSDCNYPGVLHISAHDIGVGASIVALASDAAAAGQGQAHCKRPVMPFLTELACSTAGVRRSD